MISCKVNLYTVICEKGVILCGIIESVGIISVDIGFVDVFAVNVMSGF